MYKEKHKHVSNTYHQQRLGIYQYLKVMSVTFKRGMTSFTLSQVIGHHTDRQNCMCYEQLSCRLTGLIDRQCLERRPNFMHEHVTLE